MQRRNVCLVIASLSPLVAYSAFAQVAENGASLALQSSGVATGAGSTAWELNANGYVGTYITLSQAANVTIDANAIGIASDNSSGVPVDPDLTISIAGYNSNTSDVSASASNNYSYTTPILPAGTYAVSVQLNNQDTVSGPAPDLTVNSLSASANNGATVSFDNSNTTTNALAAATTYADNMRSAPVTLNVTGAAAGTPVTVTLQQNAFNFAAAVYGESPSDTDANSWIHYNHSGNGGLLANDTSEQNSYQSVILNPANGFNMLTEDNLGKWVNNEYTQNQTTMQLVDSVSQFAQNNGLSMRMHNMFWSTEQPNFVNSLFSTIKSDGINSTGGKAALASLESAMTSRIAYYVGGTDTATGANGTDPLTGNQRANNYEEIDVFNEPFNSQSSTDNYLGDLGYSGVASVYAQVAAAEKAAGASARLYTNEYNVLQSSPASISSSGVESGSDPYANWYLHGIQQIQNANGAMSGPISGIGMELYPTAAAISPSTMEQALLNFSTARDPSGNPIALTLSEFGKNVDSDPTQATYDTDMQQALTMIYGTPQATTFGFWGGLGGPHDTSTASISGSTVYYSLYNSTYGITPAGTTWQNWMSQFQTQTETADVANGQALFTGAGSSVTGNDVVGLTYGTYDVTVDGQTFTIDVTPGGANTFTIAVPEPVSVALLAPAGLLMVRRRRRR